MNRAYIKMLNAQLMERNTLITLLAEEARMQVRTKAQLYTGNR